MEKDSPESGFASLSLRPKKHATGARRLSRPSSTHSGQSSTSTTDNPKLTPEITPKVPSSTFTFEFAHSRTTSASEPPHFGSPVLTPPSSTRSEPSFSPVAKLPVHRPEPPIVITPDHELPQPLNTLEEDGKIVVTGDPDNLPETVDIKGRESVSDGLELHNHLSSPPSHSRRSSGVESIRTDASDDEDEPYDVKNEEAPIEPFFEEEFQEALEKSRGVAMDLYKEIKSLRVVLGKDEMFAKILEEARRLTEPQVSTTRTIAILGASGEGKSTLINSLLHTPELARTVSCFISNIDEHVDVTLKPPALISWTPIPLTQTVEWQISLKTNTTNSSQLQDDNGSACTSVAMEYRQKKPSHTAPFTIEAEYLSSTEIEELIEELVWSFRKPYIPYPEEEDKPSKDEQENNQKESDQAWSALEAAFGHKDSFSRAFLSDMAEGASAKITKQLLKWSKEIEWPDDGESGFWEDTAETIDECSEKTSVFMENRLWPFTKIIRVYLDAEVLKTGVVLADLPARVRITQKYILSCDHVFIAATINRALNNNTLHSALYSELARHMPLAWETTGDLGMNLKVAVICTKTETITHSSAKRTYVGAGKVIPEAEMDNLEKEIAQAQRNRDKGLKKQLEKRLDWMYIEARNNSVKQKLRAAYQQRIPGGYLDVFCISNTTYQKYSETGNVDMIEKSGIPELRRFCRKITARAQLLQALHFMRSEVPSLLNSIKIWVECFEQTPNARDKDADNDVLEKYENARERFCKAGEVIGKTHATLRTNFQGNVMSLFMVYILPAIRTQESQLMLFTIAASYRAFCRNDGDHWTNAVGKANWNAEIIVKMRLDLMPRWQEWEEEIPVLFSDLLAIVKYELDALKKSVAAVKSGRSMANGITFSFQDFEYKIALMQEVFIFIKNSQVQFYLGVISGPLNSPNRTIEQYATEPNHSSYILMEMLPTYKKTGGDSGRKLWERQKDAIYGQVSNSSMFPNIGKRVRTGAIELMATYFGMTQTMSNEMFDSIHTDLGMVLAKRPKKEEGSEEMKGVMGKLGRDIWARQKMLDEIVEAVVGY
ncbi:Dynamin GTPase domain protein [Rutstroemia sp. NJR-2017a BBW]|nr:Dynamin GTPase domain protein [Rutstroemia sp. NJR-2017a BBW]